MRSHKIIVVEDERLLGKSIHRYLSNFHECQLFDNAEEARIFLENNSVDVVVSDIRLPGISGMELLQWIREKQLNLHVIMMTAHSSIRNAVEAIKQGASDYITKPLDLDELEFSIRRVLETQGLREEIKYHRNKQQQGHSENYLTGNSVSSQEVESILQRLIEVEEKTGETPSVLITGPTGTGKTALALRLHQRSPRADGPFIELNCTAVTETMFESELFGHEKGAFTGALGKRIGLFELAHGGTLFLDEIGHAPLSIQAKLLKAIESKKVRRVGGNQEIPLNVRLIGATNLNLKAAIQQEKFREDLYHRLALIHLQMSSLRERPEDIRPLAEFFLNAAKSKYQLEGPKLTENNFRALEKYSWPGNIRELSNEIERSVLLYNGKGFRFDYLSQLSSEVPELPPNSSMDAFLKLPPEGLDLAILEKKVLEQALIQTDQNFSQAALLLKINRSTLRYRIEKHHIDLEDLTGYSQPIPEEGVPLEHIEKIVIEQALKRTNGNVTGAARLLNTSRDVLRYRVEKYQIESTDLQ
ncbi:MAG: sigma 54-interacting transcriptional regulator [SAR324 cluster bacterium]|nr:sigma 54-interacting transcriptional regulator [SAR324 cluster bacterium]